MKKRASNKICTQKNGDRTMENLLNFFRSKIVTLWQMEMNKNKSTRRTKRRRTKTSNL
jgi:hypothetical protein